MRYINSQLLLFSLVITIANTSCGDMEEQVCRGDSFDYQEQMGCDGKIYPDPERSPYILPFPAGQEISVGLSNCSSSFHGPGQPDQYAYDFDFPVGTSFYAVRAGEVVKVVESESSAGGGTGNYVIVRHDDDSYGLYLHSPENGIVVEEGERVFQGRELGAVGMSGLAGYSHLHFIVVKDPSVFPYEGIPVTFNNVFPREVILRSFATYQVCEP